MAAWFEMTVEVPPEYGELVADFLFDHGTPGLQCEDREGRTSLIAYFPDHPPLERVRQFCAAIGSRATRPCVADIHVRTLEDENWAENWKLHFRPQCVGDRLYVCPSWDCTPPADRIALIIDPGMAFGTGQHASTRGCLRLLDDTTRQARIVRALDLGTGSGVLAIALAKLGVTDVWAIDNDPVACAVATANATRNSVGDVIRVVSSLADTPGAFDLVVANLFANLLLQLAPELRHALHPDAALILSGFLHDDEARVRAAYTALGFRQERRYEEDAWVTLAVRRTRVQ